MKHSPNFSARFLRNFFAAAILFLSVPLFAQMIDLNGDGMSDIWEWIYGTNGVVPSGDSDGDGMSNGQEAIAGTNPFDSNSIPKISFGVVAGTNFTVTMTGVLGKQYQLQSVATLGDTNWVNETNLVAQTGTNVTLSAPASSDAKFFRVAISDVDSDGAGLSDWEKYQLGLNVSNAFSNAQQDGNGNAMKDYQYVTNKLAQQNVITISATDPITTQPDPGQSPTDLGVFTVTRGGFPLNSITVNLGLGGPGTGFATAGLDYSALPPSVTLPAGTSSKTINVTPLTNTNLLTPVITTLQLLSGANYTVGGASNASVVIYPSVTANGTGLTGLYYTNASTNYLSVTNFNSTNLFLTRIDPVIDFTWTNGTSPNLSNGTYSVRWTGQVQPQYSEIYFFDVKSDDGAKLWINDQLIIDKWQTQSAEWTNAIVLQGGTRYNIKLDYLQKGGTAQAHLYWYSPTQSKQIIPNNRLYPTNSYSLTGGSNAPAAITSALSAVAFLGQPFSFTVTGANTPLGFTAAGLPPGLNFNSTNGIINGTPLLAGDYQVALTSSNAVGVGASVVDILVVDSGSSVVQEIWTGVPGTNIADIPTGTPANLTNNLGSLEGITDYDDNYGERIRGFLTAPVTGNYYFWIAGSDAAELWISDDGEPVNKVRRAFVTPTNNPVPPPQNGTASRQWNLQSSQKSGWLALTAGQKYYIEILHKAGAGTNDNWAVGWLQDPTGTNNTPAGVVPGYVLSRYYPPLPATIPGTLYTANMLALPGATSTGVGSATLRLSADGSQAVLNFQMNNLAGVVTAEHIDADPYLNYAAVPELFDISIAHPQADGSYVWKIKDILPLHAADILEILNEGKASIKIETSLFAGGEIGGHFTLANGTQNFNPPPAPQPWTDDHADPNAAVRFLSQATFGASSNDIVSVQSLGYDAWINNQFSLPPAHHLPLVLANASTDPTDPYPSTLWFNTWWQQSVTAPDQLRQRVAFALSEIMVVSENGVLSDNARVLSSYYDTLLDNSFGNFRSLLKAMTLTPAQGLYLNMQGNDKGSIITGLHANENFAREVQQLFSVGLNRLWPDGSLILNSQGNIVPTYNQNVVMGFAATFTGWNYYQTNQANGQLPSNFGPSANYTNPMVLVPSHHDLGAKLLLDNVVLPPASGNQLVSSTTNDAYCSQDLESAMDSIFNNQNVGPFICRQLIQRLVTSNPSRDYLYRVVQKFNDNGSGVRGDMQAVVKAILLDYEARSTNLLSAPTYGKQREPLARITAIARAFPAPPNNGGTYSETNTQTISVTTTNAHRLNNGDITLLTFTDTSGNPPPLAQAYSVTVTATNKFNITAPGLASGTYGQTNNVITVTISSHGLLPYFSVYLTFTTGNATNGVYQVLATPDGNHFTVATADPATNSGNCLFPRLTGGGFTVQNKTNLTVITSLAQGLIAGDSVYLNFSQAGSPPDGIYSVASTVDPTHFTAITTATNNQTQNGLTIYPLVTNAMPLVRSGNISLQENTWNLGYTDTGGSASLSQSPLRSPTVFNFFFPNYEFPGTLSSAGLTTPEFQLTSDTSVALQMNFLQAGILGNTGNTNGLSSYNSGNGAIILDIGPWMTTNYTAAAGVPSLVDGLNSVLLAGQLSAAAKTNIVKYVTNTVNFSYSSPPTQTQMRDRVRAVVHLLITSPDFTIQK